MGPVFLWRQLGFRGSLGCYPARVVVDSVPAGAVVEDPPSSGLSESQATSSKLKASADASRPFVSRLFICCLQNRSERAAWVLHSSFPRFSNIVPLSAGRV